MWLVQSQLIAALIILHSWNSEPRLPAKLQWILAVVTYCHLVCTRDSILKAISWHWPLTFKLFCVQRQIKLLQQRKNMSPCSSARAHDHRKKPFHCEPKTHLNDVPKKNTLQPLGFLHSLQGKKIQTVSTPPPQLGFFSLCLVVKKKKTRFQRQLALWMSKTDQTFKSAPKNDSTDTIDRPNKTRHFSNSTRTFFFPSPVDPHND